MTESTGRTSSPEYINLRNMMQRLLKIYSSLNNEYLILIAQRSYENKRKTTTTEEMLIFHHKMRFSELINSKSALQTDCLSEQNKVCSSFIFLYKKKKRDGISPSAISPQYNQAAHVNVMEVMGLCPRCPVTYCFPASLQHLQFQPSLGRTSLRGRGAPRLSTQERRCRAPVSQARSRFVSSTKSV